MSSLSPRQRFLLELACKPINEAFGNSCYLVGTAALDRSDHAPRDVDVRLILWDAEFAKLSDAIGLGGINFLGFAIGQYIASITSLNVDFQIQQQTAANSKHTTKGTDKVRNAMGIIGIADYRGDAHPAKETTP